MASLEQRGSSYRVVFRFAGIKYARALETSNEKTAQAALARLEDNLHRLQIGTLEAPPQGDLAGFLLADGRPHPTPSRAATSSQVQTGKATTLAGLFAQFWGNLPEGGLEKSTMDGMKFHQRQLEKHFGKSLLVHSLTLTQLQDYVKERSKDKGLHGRKVKATTIKKAFVTLRTVWNWGRQHELIEKELPLKGLKYPKGAEKCDSPLLSDSGGGVNYAASAGAYSASNCSGLL